LALPDSKIKSIVIGNRKWINKVNLLLIFSTNHVINRMRNEDANESITEKMKIPRYQLKS
jgi:hypothetical protein